MFRYLHKLDVWIRCIPDRRFRVTMTVVYAAIIALGIYAWSHRCARPTAYDRCASGNSYDRPLACDESPR